MLKIGSLLFGILLLGACASTPTVQQSPKRVYIVKENDNFHAIAFAFELSVEQLRRANPWLSPINLAPGMRLTIPDNASIKQPGGDIDFIWPLKHQDVSFGFGYRNGSLHAGIDLRAPQGTQIFASADGRVVFAGRRRGYGRMIIIEHSNGIETVHANNRRNIVSLGEQVRQGQMIATVGG